LYLDYRLAYQRGIEAVIWSMPAIGIRELQESGFKDYGISWNDVVLFSKPPAPRYVRQGSVVVETSAFCGGRKAISDRTKAALAAEGESEKAGGVPFTHGGQLISRAWRDLLTQGVWCSCSHCWSLCALGPAP